jgi:hypothetical protein
MAIGTTLGLLPQLTHFSFNDEDFIPVFAFLGNVQGSYCFNLAQCTDQHIIETTGQCYCGAGCSVRCHRLFRLPQGLADEGTYGAGLLELSRVFYHLVSFWRDRWCSFHPSCSQLPSWSLWILSSAIWDSRKGAQLNHITVSLSNLLSIDALGRLRHYFDRCSDSWPNLKWLVWQSSFSLSRNKRLH